MSLWQWGLELLLTVLLGATLFYAVRLERSISVLRRDRAGLGDVLAAIRIALADAERGIQALQGMAESTCKGLLSEIDIAAQAQHDLQFLLGRLEGVAAKVETTIKSGRAFACAEDPPSTVKPAYSKAERDLLKVLRLSK